MIYAETVYFDNQSWEAKPHNEDNIYQALKDLLTNYGQHSAYYQVDNKPVIPIYLSYLTPGESWQNIFNKLEDDGLEAVFLADYGNESSLGTDLDIFTGLHLYGNPGFIADVNQVELVAEPLLKRLGKIVQNYPLLTNNPNAKIWAPAVNPGYDDRQIPGRYGAINNIYIDRDNGNFYQVTFEAVFKK